MVVVPDPNLIERIILAKVKFDIRNMGVKNPTTIEVTLSNIGYCISRRLCITGHAKIVNDSTPRSTKGQVVGNTNNWDVVRRGNRNNRQRRH